MATFSRLLKLFLFLAVFNLSNALTYRGADISSARVVEQGGLSYKDVNGNAGALETILKNNGMNVARIRIWTAGTYNTAYGLALAKRVKAAGLQLMVDLHYSDTWADPGHQSIPSGWGTSVSSLNNAIHNYTAGIVSSFNAQGTPIDILQIGNEINDGFLWPTGKGSSGGWNAASQFLHSAREGARASGFSGKTLIHISDGWNTGTQNWFYDNIFVQGAFSTSDFDLIGVSIYPFYNTAATLAALQSTTTTLANRFRKPIIFAETDWPATACSTTLSANFPKTPAGQQQWTSALTTVAKALPNGLGQGIIYWEPGWTTNANLGSSCADNVLFDPSGRARVSVNIFNLMN